MTRKLLYLVRHAEAEHNQREKAAQRRAAAAGEDPEAARERALADPALVDPQLSDAGRAEAGDAAEQFRAMLRATHYPAPAALLVSPLQRALQTAAALFGDDIPDRRALEVLREKRTGRACDERRPAAVLAAEFPGVDFADVAAADDASADAVEFAPHLREDNAALGERAARFLEALRDEPARAVAVVAHKGFLRELRPHISARPSELCAVFGNAEVRVCEVEWRDGRPRAVARSLRGATTCPPMRVRVDSETPGFPAALKRQVTGSSGCGCVGAAVGASACADDAAAVAAAWDQAAAEVPEPDLALFFADSSVDPAVASAVLRARAPGALVAGGSSAYGVLTADGPARVGVLALEGLGDVGVGSSPGAAGDAAAEAGRAAAAQAVAGMAALPDLVLLFAAPGQEEAVLEGVRSVVGDVPLAGGSSAGRLAAADWWQLAGPRAGADGAVVVAVSLAAGAQVDCTFSHCYAPSRHSGVVTRAAGRTVEEIDHRPAADVLNEWTGGALHDALRQPGEVSILEETALSPLGVGGRLVHPRAVVGGRAVACFADVPLGPVRALGSRAADLPGALAAAAKEACSRVSFPVAGAHVVFCGGSATALEDLAPLAEALAPVLPEFLLHFTFGEQGMIEGRAAHGNLMIHITLFG